MSRSLRFLDSVMRSGSHNMALDETLLRAVQDGAGLILRLYGWNPLAVSLGYAQDVETELDVSACRLPVLSSCVGQQEDEPFYTGRN